MSLVLPLVVRRRWLLVVQAGRMYLLSVHTFVIEFITCWVVQSMRISDGGFYVIGIFLTLALCVLCTGT